MDDRQRYCILCLNAGSSSIKAALFGVSPPAEPHRLARIATSGIGEEKARLSWQIRGERSGESERPRHGDHRAALAAILDTLRHHRLPAPTAVAHRIVRSPPDRSAPALLDSELRETLERCRDLAPLHMPAELDAIDAAAEHFPDAVQAVCFDNHFFAGLPAVAKRLPLPRELADAGIERIGYHGLSYEYIAHRLGRAEGRTIVAHLGNGASMAALRDGRPIDTTMGYTPTGGLMMGTRSGDLDPGVLIALVRRQGLDADGLEALVNSRSGLLGVSSGEASMEALLARYGADAAAREAVELFCYIARKHLGALIAALGGIDTLVFTGGIGEHAPAVRERIVAGLENLGLLLDRRANAARMADIADRHSHARIRVIATDEDWVMARHAAALLAEKETA